MRYIRTTTKHEDDVFPVAVWLVTAYASAFASGFVTGEIFKALGYTQRLSVEVVGGGHSTTINPVSGEWYGGMVSVVVLLSVFGAWYLRDWYRA